MKTRTNFLDIFKDRGYSKLILDADGKAVGSITREPGSTTTTVSISRNGNSSIASYTNHSLLDGELKTTIPYSVESEKRLIPFPRKAA